MKTPLRTGSTAAILIIIICAALIAGASDNPIVAFRPSNADRISALPDCVIWAWERRENLDFIDPDKIAVAYLAYTLDLAGDRVLIRPRLQPLSTPPHTNLIPVVRIEDDSRYPPSMSAAQCDEAATIISGLARRPFPAAIQIDFDARRSERAFYRGLLSELRGRLPQSIALSITAFASWCIGDDWIDGLPVDEATPMLYRMGPDAARIRAYLRGGGVFHSRLCRASIGLSLDEKMPAIAMNRRLYLYSPKPWTEARLHEALERANQ